jgi:hypothetical protein
MDLMNRFSNRRAEHFRSRPKQIVSGFLLPMGRTFRGHDIG